MGRRFEGKVFPEQNGTTDAPHVLERRPIDGLSTPAAGQSGGSVIGSSEFMPGTFGAQIAAMETQGKRVSAGDVYATEKRGILPLSSTDLELKAADAEVRAATQESRAVEAETRVFSLEGELASEREGRIAAERTVVDLTKAAAQSDSTIKAERERATLAEQRAAKAEAEVERLQEQVGTTAFDDKHGYYMTLGITPAFFEGKSEEEIAAILDGFKRGYGKANAKTISIPEGSEAEAAREAKRTRLKRLQKINEAADRLKDQRYRSQN